MDKYQSTIAARNDTCLEIHGECGIKSNGAAFYVTDIRAGICNVIRLLVHGFFGGATGHDRKKYERCATNTYRCRFAKNADAVNCCFAGSYCNYINAACHAIEGL